MMEEKKSNPSSWSSRSQTADEVRKKLRSGWRYDSEVLEQYFQSCYLNWQVYQGERTPKQVLKLQALYKQAVYGDNEESPPQNMESLEGKKWSEWYKYKGTPQETAKRRFITFLAEINPSLIDVMPDEKPPIGFPLDKKGNPICAKCNTVVGCARPLLDQYKMNLKQQLFDNEEFHDPDKLVLWIRNGLENQRCVWGMHKAISKAEARPFMDWFNRLENRGFFAYDSISLMKIVRELVFQYFEMAYEMMKRKTSVEFDPLEYNELAIKTSKMKEIFEKFTGEEFKFEQPCSRDNDICNARRLADGGLNHLHEVEIDPPTFSDADTMAEAIALRTQCQKLGINPCTGVVKSVSERCNIYRQRISDHIEALKKSQEAKIRNDNRSLIHKEEKSKISRYSKSLIDQQGQDACNANNIAQIMLLVKQQHGNPNVESNRGLTPLLCMILNEVPIERIDDLIKSKVDVNFVNRYGLTALMLACRLKDTKMIHYLMKNNTSAMTKGGTGRTALHHCIIHSCEDIIRILVDYLKDGVGDSMRIVRFLDANDDNGESALMLAARLRNGLLCYLLLSMGANPNNRNSLGQTAAYIARQSGWNELANYLDKKVSTGVSKIETYSDLQFEKQNRMNHVKTKDLLEKFGKLYLQLIQQQRPSAENQFQSMKRGTKLIGNPIGCPYKSQTARQERGDLAIYEQQTFIDHHCKYLLNIELSEHARLAKEQSTSPTKAMQRLIYQFDNLTEEEIIDMKRKLQSYVTEMTNLVKQGNCYPNTEILAKPLPWTPLMCAIAVNDLRSCKILIRSGADVNHPNMDGTTPLMLAAQLQCTHLLIELLLLRGDIDCVDNQGFNALGYASSLPLPTVMQKSWSDILTDDDLFGEKQMNTVQVIKIVKAGGLSQLRAILAENAELTSSERIQRDLKVQKLLEQYGLTNMSHDYNLSYQVKSCLWRVDLKETGETRDMDAAEDEDVDQLFAEYEAKAKQLFTEEQEENKKKHQESAFGTVMSRGGTPSSGLLRCPICTLPIPCAHFLKIKSLMTYLKKSKEDQEAERNKMTASTHYHTTKKLKIKDHHQQILDETDLADRHTDRSLTLARKYQARERALEISWQEQTEEPPVSSIDVGNNNADSTPAVSESLVLENNYYNTENRIVSANQAIIPAIDAPGGNINEESVVTSVETPQPLVSILKRPSSSIIDDPASSWSLVPVSTDKKPSKHRVKFNLPGELQEEEAEAEESNEAFASQQSESNLMIEDSSKSSDDGNTHSKELILIADDEDIAPQGKSNDLIRAMKTLQQGALITVAESDDTVFSLKEDPLTQYPRRVVMITREKFNAGKSSDVRSSKQSDGAMKMKINISGWLFVHLATIEEDILPIENICIAQDAWAFVLDHIKNKFFEEWMATNQLKLLFDVKTLKISAPHCSLCKIGFVRNKESLSLYRRAPNLYYQKANQMMKLLVERSRNKKDDSFGAQSEMSELNSSRKGILDKDLENQEEIKAGSIPKLYLDPYLCMQCLIRKEIYDKVIQSLPRTIRKTMQLTWPIIHMHQSSSNSTSTKDMSVAPSFFPPSSFSTSKSTPSIPLSSNPTLSSTSPSLLPPLLPDAFVRNMVPPSLSPPKMLASPSSSFHASLNLSPSQTPLFSSFNSGNFAASPASPVASQTLFELDELVVTHSSHSFKTELDVYRALEEGDEIEMPSMSQMSFGDDATTTSANSTISTISQVDPIKRPREMTLIPFLIAKGHMDEAERMIRITIGKQAIDEGEGLLYLCKLLSWQADMYKSMGLYPLALSVYMDLVDLAGSLLGLTDYLTKKCMANILACYYQMQASDFAKVFISDTLQDCMEAIRSHSSQQEIVQSLKSILKQQKQVYYQKHTVWKQLNHLDMNISQKFTDSCATKEESTGKSELRKEFEEYFGVSSFYQFLIAVHGQELIAKNGFFLFLLTRTHPYTVCASSSLFMLLPKPLNTTLSSTVPSNIKLSASEHHQGIELLETLLQLRIYEEEEITNHLLHKIFVKYLPVFTFTKPKKNGVKYSAGSTSNKIKLSKTSTNSMNPIVQIFLHSINKETKQAIVLYLQEGIFSFEWKIFDAVLLWLLHYYLPFFHRFLIHEPGGEIIRNVYGENIAMMHDIAAKLIQGVVRRKLSLRRVQHFKVEREKTKLKDQSAGRQDNGNSGGLLNLID